MVLKLPRLPVNWAAQPEMFRRYWDQVANFLENSGTGYAAGAGGTVTQATSKGSAVTLNKLCGQIITNNSSLGAGDTATFTVNCNPMASTDVVVINVPDGNYSARAYNNSEGSFIIALKNETAGSLSDAVTINFAIIKAVTS